jgi:hypothetical protein
MAKIANYSYPTMSKFSNADNASAEVASYNWQRIRTLWPKTSAEGTHISMLSMAYCSNRSKGSIRDEIWLTDEEYTFKKLKGEI